jgi:predicted nucleotidyltransferase
MYKHHQDTINNVIKKMKEDDKVLALIIGGSIAHGFAKEDSDVDIMMVVSQEEYERRFEADDLTYWEQESSTYENGYVDGKYVSIDFMEKVSKMGSEPARFAFKDAFIAYSNIPELQKLMDEITRYPKELKQDRMSRFYAQLNAWKWFYYEGMNKKNTYLIDTAISNMVLFGGRAVLAYNELLYPFHKWFLRVLEGAKDRPENLMQLIDAVLEEKSPEAVESYYLAIKTLTDWGQTDWEWPKYFMKDSELGWMTGNSPIADI